MKKAILTALAVLVAIIVLVLGVAATRPAEFHIERATEISAPAASVYAVFSDFGRFSEWSPWSKLDPSMKTTVVGTSGTVGSSYAWEGNDKVGAGKMTFTEVRPGEQAVLTVEFFRPFPATNTVTWSAKDAGNASRVVWAMDGRNEQLMQKLFSMLMMESIVGKDFENGLAQLKAIVESAPR